MNKKMTISQLNSLAVIKVSGNDAEKFLQGQLTCDIREITAEHNSLGAYCNIQGRVIATFRIFKLNTDYYLLTPNSMVNMLIETLKKYIIIAKVSLENVTSQFSCVGIFGPTVSQSLQTIFNKIPAAVNETIQINEAVLLKIPGADKERFLLVGPKTEIENSYADLFQKQFTTTNEEQWQQLDILADIPTIYPATSTLFTPHMLNLPALDAVSFKKGCYVGQEIIARTEYLGKTKRQLQQLQIKTENKFYPGDKLFNEKQEETGIVVNACLDKENYWLLLVVTALS